MAAKHWYWKFNVDAWLTDPGLSVVSLEAQGLWFRCLCLMFKNDDKRGFLEHRGKKITSVWLAKSVGSSPARVEKLLKELEAAEVFSRDERGVIFNRRMVKDEELRQQAKENGKLGGNPTLVQGVNPPVKGGDNGGDKSCVTTNYCSSPSSLKEEDKPSKSKTFSPAEVELPKDLDTPEFRASWVEWCDYRRAAKKPISQQACSKQLSKLAQYGAAKAIAAISKAIESDHQGLYPESVDPLPRAGPHGKQTASDHNRTSAAKALEVLNAARRRNEDRSTVSFPGLPWDQDGTGGDASVD